MELESSILELELLIDFLCVGYFGQIDLDLLLFIWFDLFSFFSQQPSSFFIYFQKVNWVLLLYFSLSYLLNQLYNTTIRLA